MYSREYKITTTINKRNAIIKIRIDTAKALYASKKTIKVKDERVSSDEPQITRNESALETIKKTPRKIRFCRVSKIVFVDDRLNSVREKIKSANISKGRRTNETFRMADKKRKNIRDDDRAWKTGNLKNKKDDVEMKE